jgi:O-antigen ligase
MLVISIWVELGILGMAFFIWFFAYLFIRLKRVNMQRRVMGDCYPLFYKNDFMVLLLILLIFNIFYFNYWEYPEMIVPIMTFVIISITGKKQIAK